MNEHSILIGRGSSDKSLTTGQENHKILFLAHFLKKQT